MSKRFELTIDCENAAFEESPAFEVANILQGQVIEAIRSGRPFPVALLDTNGNRVGTARFVGFNR